MEEKRANSAAWAAALTLLLTTLLSAYAAAYFLRSDYRDDPFIVGPSRDFASEREASFFWPAIQIESAARGFPVEATFPGFEFR